jgi:hypothetical protein
MTCLVGSDTHGGLCVATAQRRRLRVAAMPSLCCLRCVLPPLICEGAASVGSTSVTEWRQAAGVWMLVHESFHLRHWRFRRNEAKVGCQTIVYFTDAAPRLGASEVQAREFYPHALALHDLEIDVYPWHRDPQYIVPPWVPPPAP